MMQIFVFVMGVICLALSVWERKGTPETRSWVAQTVARSKGKSPITGHSESIIRDERFSLLGLPAMGVFCLGLAGLQLSVLPGGVLGTFLFAICVILVSLSFIGVLGGIIRLFPFPDWLRPGWLRKYYQDLGIDPIV